MKRITLIFTAVIALFATSCSYDDSAIYKELDSIKSRISALENSMSQLSDYQTIRDKVNNGKFIVSCTQGTDGSYTITFSDKTSITIKNGKDGQNGTNGQNGKDGITPIFKIENESWYVSYDEGKNWAYVGSAIDKSLFKAVKVEGEYLKLTLADDTVVVLAIGEKNQFKIVIDESGIVMASDNAICSRSRRMEIPFTLQGKLSDPRVIVSFEYGEYNYQFNEQMFYAEVKMNEAKDGGVIKFKQPMYCYFVEEDGCYYMESVGGRMNIMAFNGDGLSCARSKTINSEDIICQPDMDTDWEYIGLTNGTPTYKMPKAGGVFRMDVWRTEKCYDFDVTKMVRPTKFDDVFIPSMRSDYGTFETTFVDNGLMSGDKAYSESYTAYFNIKANTGTTQKHVSFSIAKFHTESQTSFVHYFPCIVVLSAE